MAADPFASLPRDLLTAICAFFPLRPRLLVVSRLSKRWHAAALASVTEVHGQPLAVLAQFPNITATTAPAGTAEAALPTTLRALTIASPSNFSFDAVARLTLLTHLECSAILDDDRESWRRVTSSFVAKYADQLRHLDLVRVPADAVVPVVRHYASLTSLSFSCEWMAAYEESMAASVVQLIALNAQQLKELCLEFDLAEPFACVASLLCPLPRLHVLRLTGTEAWLHLLLRHVPAACDVRYTPVPGETFTERAYPYVTSLALMSDGFAPPGLAQCTKLDSLSLTRSDPTFYATHTPPPLLRELYHWHTPPPEWLVPLCSLVIVALPSLPPSLCLAHVETLRFAFAPLVDSVRGLLALCDVIAACPRLRSLGGTDVLPLSKVSVADLEMLAHTAEVRGVECLLLSVRGLATGRSGEAATVEQLRRVPRAFHWLRLYVNIKAAPAG